MYGDTILKRVGADGSSWRNNSWSWTGDFDARDGLAGWEAAVDAAGAPLELFPRTAEETAFNEAHAGDPCRVAPCKARKALWAGPVVEDAARGVALAFYTKIYGEPGPWNFRGLGCGVALWTDVRAQAVRRDVRPSSREPTLLWTADDVFCPSATFIDNGVLYVWSCIGGDKLCKLARVDPGRVTQPAAWTYRARGGWIGDVRAAEKSFAGNDMMTVHRRGDGWLVAVYSAPLARAIRYRTATAPEGPWSGEGTLFEAMLAKDGAAPYSGLAHAELARDGREIVSYFRGTEPWRGEVRLTEVELR